MRQVSRAFRAAIASRPQNRHNPHACRFSTVTASRVSSESAVKTGLSLVEDLRRKLWSAGHNPGHHAPPPGRRATKAPPQRPTREAQAQVDAATYEPAKTWHTLEWVGGEGWQSAEGIRAAVASAERLHAWRTPVTPVQMTTTEVTLALRRALVEVYAARTENMSFAFLSEDTIEDRSVRVRLSAGKYGVAIIRQIGSDEQPPNLHPEEDSKAWKHVSLRDPAVKFAVVKRVMQLTGLRIPDLVISRSQTAGSLLRGLVTPPEPVRLAQRLVGSHALSKLPNVNISVSRVTPIDTEKKIGRWKLIEQALLDRNLPVTGHDVRYRARSIEKATFLSKMDDGDRV